MQGGPTLTSADKDQDEKLAAKKSFRWTDRHSAYDVTNARAMAEDELLSLRKSAYVLNLCGLWVSVAKNASLSAAELIQSWSLGRYSRSG